MEDCCVIPRCLRLSVIVWLVVPAAFSLFPSGGLLDCLSGTKELSNFALSVYGSPDQLLRPDGGPGSGFRWIRECVETQLQGLWERTFPLGGSSGGFL